MKKSNYGKKVTSYLNENKYKLSSLLLEEEEDPKDSGGSSDDTLDDPGSTDDPKDSDGSSDDTLDDPSSTDDPKDNDAAAAAEQAKKRKEEEVDEVLNAIKNKLAEKIPDHEQQGVDPIMAGVFDSYYRQVKGLQKFIFEDDSEEKVVDFDRQMSIPTLVNNTIHFISNFDSMFDKVQYCYDVAVEQIITHGGLEFQKLLDEFDESFHEAYRKSFPEEEESPVMNYVNNDNYKNAADAQKSG